MSQDASGRAGGATFYFPVLTECAQCCQHGQCQWDGVDGEWFCRACWAGPEQQAPPPNSLWPHPSILLTKSQATAAASLRPWLLGLSSSGPGGGARGDLSTGDGRQLGASPPAGGGALVLGFDIEWRPNFVKGSTLNPKP
jgi:hypothetical protein